MSRKLSHFMSEAYRNKVLGVPVDLDRLFDQFVQDPEFVEAADTEVRRVHKLGEDAARRDFPGYKGVQVLESALKRWRDRDAVTEGQ